MLLHSYIYPFVKKWSTLLWKDSHLRRDASLWVPPFGHRPYFFLSMFALVVFFLGGGGGFGGPFVGPCSFGAHWFHESSARLGRRPAGASEGRRRGGPGGCGGHGGREAGEVATNMNIYIYTYIGDGVDVVRLPTNSRGCG